VAAGALASVPAVLGLAGNPSFSQQVPVRPPEHARVLQLHHAQPSAAIPSATARAVTITTASPTARTGSDGQEAEPGDDRGRDRNRDGDRRGGDDNGRHYAEDDGSRHGEGSGGRHGHDDG
jgi:hypothetical protein